MTTTRRQIACTGCAARVVLADGVDSGTCPACGRAYRVSGPPAAPAPVADVQPGLDITPAGLGIAGAMFREDVAAPEVPAADSSAVDVALAASSVPAAGFLAGALAQRRGQVALAIGAGLLLIAALLALAGPFDGAERQMLSARLHALDDELSTHSGQLDALRRAAVDRGHAAVARAARLRALRADLQRGEEQVATLQRSQQVELDALRSRIDAARPSAAGATSATDLTALIGRVGHQSTQAIAVPGTVDAMLLAGDGRRLFLLLGTAGQVQELLLDQRALGRVFTADSALTSMDFGSLPGGETLMLVGAAAPRLVGMSTTTFARNLDVGTDRAFALVSNLGGSTGQVLLHHPGNPLANPRVVHAAKANADGSRSFYELALGQGARLCRSAGPYFVMLKPTARGLRVDACRHDRLSGFITRRQIIVDRVEATGRGLPPEIASQRVATGDQEIARHLDELRKAITSYDIASDVIAAMGPHLPTVVAAGERLIIARRLLSFAANGDIALDGEFAPGPALTAIGASADAAARANALALEGLSTTSPDGRWAVSATAVYDVSTRKPVRRLPFIAAVHCFSADGRHLYLYDSLRRQVYAAEDWQTTLTALAP